MVHGFVPRRTPLTDVLFMQQRHAVTESIVIFLGGIQQEHKIRGILIQIRHMRGMIIKRMIGAEVWFHMKFMQEKMEHWQFGQIQH